MLIAAFLLVAGSIAAAAVGRWQANQTAGGQSAGPAVVAAYDIRFVDRPDGSLAAHLDDGRLLLVLSSEESGFARGVQRGFVRMRQLSRKSVDGPYRLTRLADGRFLMEATDVGMSIDLGVFGSANAASLARVWRAGDALKPAGTG